MLPPRSLGVGEGEAVAADGAVSPRRPAGNALRLAPGDERLSDFGMAAAAARFMEGMGLEANPWVVIRDAPDACHIVASRVDHAAEVWKGRLDQREAQKACQAVEAEFGLIAAPRARNPAGRAPSQQENWVIQRTGQVSDRAVLAEKVLEAVQRTQWSGSTVWFERECTKRGVLAASAGHLVQSWVDGQDAGIDVGSNTGEGRRVAGPAEDRRESTRFPLLKDHHRTTDRRQDQRAADRNEHSMVGKLPHRRRGERGPKH